MLTIRRITEIGRAYRNLKRYKEILHILFKYGFGDILEILKIEHFLETGIKGIFSRAKKEEPGNISSKTRPEKVRMALEELGPTFVKLGQILSTRPDLIPLGYADELAKLQDHVPPFPYEFVEKTIYEEFGKAPDEIFDNFEKTPFAAASIGQVHRAKLKNGREVVIKVQRPGIGPIIETDLEIMHYLAKLMERHLKEFEIQRPSAIVDEFARSIEKEISFKTEAYSLERFRSMVKADKTVTCPEVFREFTTDRILTMEFINGIKSSNIEKLREEGYNFELIAARGAETVMKQVFEYGFFHADPHPGNIFILPDNVICFIDFGMMGRVSRQEQEEFSSLMFSIIHRDEKGAVRKALRLTQYEIEPDEQRMQRDMGDLIDDYIDRPLKDLNFGALLEKMLALLTGYGLRLRPNLFLMMKAVISVEKLGNMFNPELDIVAHAKPYIRSIQYRRLNPKYWLQNIFDPANELFHLLSDIPEDISSLIKKTKKGELKIEFEHQGLEPFLKTITKVVNHIAFAIVLAALIIGSALITLSKIPSSTVIGMLGFLISGVLGFWLLWDILRRGKIK